MFSANAAWSWQICAAQGWGPLMKASERQVVNYAEALHQLINSVMRRRRVSDPLAGIHLSAGTQVCADEDFADL